MFFFGLLQIREQIMRSVDAFANNENVAGKMLGETVS
jgi:hypothetical protein